MTGAAPSKKLKNAPAVRGPGGASAVERAEENLRRIMYAATGSLTQAFLRINRDRSGFVEPVELARIFRGANVALTAEELKKIV